MSNDVVGVSETTEVGGEIRAGAEDPRRRRVNSEELGHIKDLQSVVARLGANVHIVANDLHVSPRRVNGLSRQAAEVDQGSVTENLNEGSAVGLTNCTKLSAGGRSPTPCKKRDCLAKLLRS
jgi:hypothetical protein